MQMCELSDRVALITGGAGYLGREIATALLSAGAVVFVASRNFERNRQLCASMDPEGIRAMPLRLDVRDLVSVTDGFETVRRFGRQVDILVNCANASVSGAAAQLDDAAFASAFAVNVEGYYRCCRAAFPGMRERGRGAIVNIGSILALRFPIPPEGELPAAAPAVNYAAAKASVTALSRSLAVEWGRFGIRVNSVTPGAFPRQHSAHPGVPLGRTGYAHELASAVRFLVSDAAGYISGHELVVDGGWSATL